MLKIGLCGTSGSGKGYVCERLRERGVCHIDTDKVYNTSVIVKGSACFKELCAFFGEGILNGDGTLDKKALSKIVFEGEHADAMLDMLNRITHKYIKIAVEASLAENEKNGVKATLIDAPVLFESGFNDMCDVTVCVTAPEGLKLERIVKRDGISRQRAEARLKSQLPDERLRELCDYEIINDESGALDSQINELIKKLNLDK